MRSKKRKLGLDWSDPEVRRQYNKDWYALNRTKLRAQKVAWFNANIESATLWKAKRAIEIKAQVLAHYGHNGELRCVWDGCEVVDLDMLTLDHVNNDGGRQRKVLKTQGGGARIYGWTIKENFPDGYQTLCANHQIKKEIQRRAAERIERNKVRGIDFTKLNGSKPGE